MGERRVEQAALFELSLDRHVPADHMLRSIEGRPIESGARSARVCDARRLDGALPKWRLAGREVLTGAH